MKDYYFIIVQTKNGPELVLLTSNYKKFDEEFEKLCKEKKEKNITVGCYQVED